MLTRLVVGWLLSLVFAAITMGQVWSGILNEEDAALAEVVADVNRVIYSLFVRPISH